jgi:NodT family efflux transporter outer membrane factor (OMF) lipoprotein
MAALSGCATRSAYEVPKLVKPDAWQAGQPGAATGAAPASVQAGAPANSAEPRPWWLALNDPALDQQVRQALARNNGLAQSVIKAQRARLSAGQAASDQLPTVTAKGTSTVSRTAGTDGTTRTHSATLAASWELDLWGRLASLRDVADFEAQATDEDRAAAALSLSGSVANAYWQLAYLNQRVDSSAQSLAYIRQTLQLVKAQHQAGSVSGLEVAQATQALAAQEASHADWLRQRAAARNTLAVLMDGPPGATPGVVAADPARLPDTALPDVPSGLPAEVLTRRPDLRAAELRLRKTLATVDATRVGYYPALTLTGSVGGTSSSLTQVLDNPISTLGAGLVLPFIQWRDMQRSVDIAQTDYEYAVRGFRQSWYQALADVETALSARQQYAQQGLQLRVALDAAQAGERLSEARYRAGSVALKTWLDAQETRRQAELNLAANRLNQLNTWVGLVQSLGG